MDTTVRDDPLSRDLKRIELARRLISHQARTQTITQLTALTRNRLATLRRRWMVSEDMRRRGPSPSSLDVFLRTPQARSEAAAIASLCRAFGAMPELYFPASKRSATSLDAAERLCEAYEAYRTCSANSEVEFEELMLLLAGLAQGDVIELIRCKGCKGAKLVSRFDAARRACVHCERNATLETREDPTAQRSAVTRTAPRNFTGT